MVKREEIGGGQKVVRRVQEQLEREDRKFF